MAQENPLMETMPSLPQVLLNILDAIQDEQADLRSLGEIILQDPAMTARLIAVANSAHYARAGGCRSLDRAIMVLGQRTVKNVVMTAAMKQMFDELGRRHRRFLKESWRGTLVTATLAQALAALTRYPRPEEAYLCGLLVNLGRLARLTLDESRYPGLLETAEDDQDLIRREQATYGSSHCEEAAGLMAQWGLNPLLSDAVRYHLEPARQVRDAHHLVKLVNLAHALGAGEAITEGAAEAADLLFGLNEGLSSELRDSVQEDTRRLAAALEIELDDRDRTASDRRAEQRLGQCLGDLGQLDRVQGELSQVRELRQCCRAVRKVLFMTLGVEHSLLFLVDARRELLSAWTDPADDPAFVLPLERGRSAVTDTCLDGRLQVLSRSKGDDLPVVDRQLFGVCHARRLWLLPLVGTDRTVVGVLVLGVVSDTQAAQLEERRGFVRALTGEIARALGNGPPLPAGGDPDLQRRISEVIHEAGNPLTIIQNYLAMLRIKLGETHDVQQDLDLIREEIDRVGRILLRMKDVPALGQADDVPMDQLVRQVAEIFKGSLCRTRDVGLSLSLAAGEAGTFGHADHLRQVLTNLLKNAIEAVNTGGEIHVATSAPVNLNGSRYVELTVRDNGPGIPESIQSHLFSPVTSTKGEGHSGLGLSITRRLIDEMGGSIVCASGAQGTRFQILFPLDGQG
ncbi:HDOD domain-containing protein [Ectothiorhodospira lacustris]|uniref:HDOD domain-containing protein n=1 Tax=Ectothiorhodospira lacustris TaxID=2899127 RepID=UPI001EE8FC2B|nr:HDOD domain-containing protein [Ectothiorhodospira lacustris]MCG5502037.1 HDOD domain-containing protein [Ectothiorhodospira lacustris]